MGTTIDTHHASCSFILNFNALLPGFLSLHYKVPPIKTRFHVVSYQFPRFFVPSFQVPHDSSPFLLSSLPAANFPHHVSCFLIPNPFFPRFFFFIHSKIPNILEGLLCPHYKPIAIAAILLVL